MKQEHEHEEMQAIRATVSDFLKGFEPLEATYLAHFMVPEVTAFLPFGPERIDGRKAVEETFREVFAGMRRELPGPPYLRLEPQRFTIQVEAMMAVVSFELPHEGAMGRRTLVLAKQDQGWRIIHIHASEHIAV